MVLHSADSSISASDKTSRAERFVNHVIDRINKDNSFTARVRRADNPATEYQSWELLVSFDVDLENEWERIPYCTVGAALAKGKPVANGQLPLGAAIAACFTGGNQADQAKIHLRRLLACTSTQESCRILRPLLTLMSNRKVTPDFIQLLEQLLGYSGHRQLQIRAHWALAFYRHNATDNDVNAEHLHD